tara:strand:- start:184 stop:594 length:411 start_codon:yes stop_codon:yes gene_type:complete
MKKKNIIIIFPSDINQFRVANYSFRSFNNRDVDIGKEYYYIIPSDFRDSFQIRNGNIFDSYDDYSYLINKKYDLAIDLTFGDDPNLYRIMRKIKSQTKIGFAKNKLNKFLNVMIDISKDDPVEKGYINIIRMIDAI